MTPAVLYARWSPRPADDAQTCESALWQLERCRAYCLARGYDVVGEFRDEELSGGRADNRPDLQAAIEAVCKAKGVLVVYALNRLARNTRDAIDLSERLERAGADVASLSEQIDTHTPAGRLFFTILAAFAAFEREAIASRTSDAMLRHQASGRRMTRADRCPYGWQPDPRDRGRLIEDAREQATVARICQERQKGKGYLAIARALDAEGIDCRGRRWHHETIRSILARAGQVAS